MTSFCLIHGAWHDAACWDEVARILRERGHEVAATDLPYDDPSAGYAQRVAPALAGLEGIGGPLVVVGHSMGSSYAPIVAELLAASLLVHLCPRLGGFAAGEGAPPGPLRASMRLPSPGSDGLSVWDPEVAISAMYGRLAPETARALAARLRPVAAPAGAFPLAGHPDVPTALIYAADDEFFEPEWERFMAREVIGVEPIEIAGGHFPMVEDPEGLADVLERIAPG